MRSLNVTWLVGFRSEEEVRKEKIVYVESAQCVELKTSNSTFWMKFKNTIALKVMSLGSGLRWLILCFMSL